MSKFELIDLTRQAVAKTEEMLRQSENFALNGLEEAINDAVNADYDNEFIVTFHTFYDTPVVTVHREDESLTIKIYSDSDIVFISSKNMNNGTMYVINETIKKWLGE